MSSTLLVHNLVVGACGPLTKKGARVGNQSGRRSSIASNTEPDKSWFWSLEIVYQGEVGNLVILR